MAGINVLASFGTDIAELDDYEQADPGGGWATFRVRKAKADLPCPACGSLGRRVKDCAAKSCRLRSQTGVCDSCIDAPGLGRLLGNSLPEGFNDKAKTLKKAVAAYPTSSASGSGHSSSSAKATPGNEGDFKNRQTPGKVGEPQNLMGMNGNSENRHPKAPNSMGMGNGQQNSGCFLFL